MARLLLALLSALWSLLWILVSLLEILDSLHNPGAPRWQRWVLLMPSASVAVAWPCLWLGSGAFARIALDRAARWFLTSLAFTPIWAAASFAMVYGGRALVFRLVGAPYAHLPWPGLIAYEVLKVALFHLLWLGLVFGAKTFVALQAQSRNLLESRKALAEAQLHQLREQLRPHFLFNTLNTISSLLHSDIERADRLLIRLGDLLRSSLDLGDRNLVTLETELRFLELYAGIMTERFSGRVALQWQIDPVIRTALLPSLLLQPLLENAFHHGVEAVSGPQSITISAEAKPASDVLEIQIHSTGGSLPPQAAEGVGLRNCRQRLAVHYDAAAELILSAHPEGGVVAAVSLPLRREQTA